MAPGQGEASSPSFDIAPAREGVTALNSWGMPKPEVRRRETIPGLFSIIKQAGRATPGEVAMACGTVRRQYHLRSPGSRCGAKPEEPGGKRPVGAGNALMET